MEYKLYHKKALNFDSCNFFLFFLGDLSINKHNVSGKNFARGNACIVFLYSLILLL